MPTVLFRFCSKSIGLPLHHRCRNREKSDTIPTTIPNTIPTTAAISVTYVTVTGIQRWWNGNDTLLSQKRNNYYIELLYRTIYAHAPLSEYLRYISEITDLEKFTRLCKVINTMNIKWQYGQEKCLELLHHYWAYIRN
jgi:hypothetical protein